MRRLVRSLLTRPDKVPPLFSLIVGIVLFPVSFVALGENSPQGRLVAGGLLGGGIGLLIVSAWDAGRRRLARWLFPSERG